jgi:antitoxin (DNA-binding transcriptional repressor) of toxin-antitoxin stability system
MLLIHLRELQMTTIERTDEQGQALQAEQGRSKHWTRYAEAPLVRDCEKRQIEMKTIDVTDNRKVAEFIRQLSPVRQPIQIVVSGKPVARLVPIDELTDDEKEKILQKGWQAVQEARVRNKGVSGRKIGKAVDAAVRRARSEQ